MRLKGIKLAGFKSFVDPTTVSFPGNRSAVVGPNGCGKSNIIDAVRWVMGESSARQLRGEAITDVIFNGSNSRKPTSMASIELTFDNSDGRIGGEFAGYAELAIRRDVTRDAQSTYYLNGSKCRRRDIADVFLGTGFGPRSYSIIEQGMISQLVEAKPEELRGHLEEAAGISRYKERRRETENRVKHTLENLERLRDIREELERQLTHLKRQSRAAERYRVLKADDRRLTGELYALRLRAVDEELEAHQRALSGLEIEHQRAASALQHVDLGLERARVAHTERTDEFNQVQGRFYQLGADIARAEEAITFNQERVNQLELDLEAVGQRFDETARQLAMDEREIATLKADIANKAPELEKARADDAEATAALAGLEDEMRTWQAAWDAFSAQASLNDGELQVQESRIEHVDQVLQRLRSRLAQLDDETSEPVHAHVEADSLEGEIEAAERGYRALEADLETCTRKLATARDDVLMRERAIDDARSSMQSLRHELAAMEAVQLAALGREVSEAHDWIAGQGLAGAPRLGEGLVVVRGWERAVETVLAANLQAIKVDNIADFAGPLQDLDRGRVILFEGREAFSAEGDLPALVTFVRADDGHIGSLLAGVFAADALDVALKLRRDLKADQSIITRDGIWLGPDWIRIDRGEDLALGVIARGADLDTLREEVEGAEGTLADLQRHVVDGKHRVDELEAERDGLQAQHRESGQALASLRTDHGVRRVRAEEAGARRELIDRDRSETQAQVAAESERSSEARARLATLAGEAERLNAERADLTRAREAGTDGLEAARSHAIASRDRFHALNIEHQRLVSSLTASDAARGRVLEQRSDLQGRVGEVRQSIKSSQKPLPELQQELEEKLAERLAVEKQLAQVRRGLEAVEGEIEALSGERQEGEQVVDEVRNRLESARVEREGMSVKRTNLGDQLAGVGATISEALESLPDDADEETWLASLEKVDQRINRLGAINLAAIEEFEAQSERKLYLDAQNDDLQEALATLQSAIKKIDRETRVRFKSTFDEVNRHLKTLFPKVFGGGHAYLELTGEDLLDTGVSLMARPPGKRNSSVHLLSGGEKALTAVALIFAIFQLNPSPVCLLDEVDAPLDDTNVSRFADLLQEMSSDVQFVVITHNKLTMEMADHLMGVTMSEPGVSRLVSVDVEEAAAMAAV